MRISVKVIAAAIWFAAVFAFAQENGPQAEASSPCVRDADVRTSQYPLPLGGQIFVRALVSKVVEDSKQQPVICEVEISIYTVGKGKPRNVFTRRVDVGTSIFGVTAGWSSPDRSKFMVVVFGTEGDATIYWHVIWDQRTDKIVFSALPDKAYELGECSNSLQPIGVTNKGEVEFELVTTEGDCPNEQWTFDPGSGALKKQLITPPRKARSGLSPRP